MSYYLVVGGEFCGQVASLSGWKDFRGWVEKQKVPELKHLVAHGWSQDIPSVKKEIETALEKNPPSEDVADVASVVIDALDAGPQGSSSVVLTDGLAEKDDPDDSGWTSEED